MSLRDRLRETAQQAQESLVKGAQQAQEGLARGAQQAQEGLARGQAKLEQLQNRQAGSAELEALGQAYWVQQSGRASAAQLDAMLAAVRPALLETESRVGPLPWPAVPGSVMSVDPSGSSPSSTWASGAPEEAISGPVGAPAQAAPSSIPTAIHHEPPAD